MPRSWSAHSGRVTGPALAFLALLPFLNAVRGDFVYDDRAQIVRNERVRSLDPRPVLSGPSVTQGTVEWYRPLTIYTFALNYAAVGLEPALYRITNVGIHVVNTLLLRAVGTTLVGGLAASVGAAIFAVSAVHTEAVSPAFGRADLLATLWVLLGAWRALSAGSDTWRRALVIAAFFFAGLLSKESAVSFLPLMVLADLSTGRRRSKLYAALALTAGAWVGLRYWAVGAIVSSGSGIRYIENPLVEASTFGRIATGLWIVLRYVALFIVPHPLSADYSYQQIPPVESALDPRFLLVVSLVAGLAFLARRSPTIAKLAAVFVLLMAPVSNLLFPIGTIMAERLLYLPSVALCLAAGALLARLAGRRKRIATAGMVLVVSSNIAFAVNRNEDWQSDEALFEATVRTARRSAKAHYNLGSLLLETNDPGRARRHLLEAVRIAPAYPEANNLLGTIHLASGEHAEAASRFRLALEDAPDYPPALANLGMSLIREARYAEARPLLERAVDRDPGLAVAYVQLAFIAEQQGNVEEAVRFYRRGYALDSSLEVARQRAEELSRSRR